jgi:large subunit ribosomal protein L17
MRKRYNFRQLGRTTSHKWAMLRNMVTSLIEHERIVTTTAKAKEVRSLAEKVVTMAKNDNAIHARRQINRIVQTDTAATKLLNVLGPRYALRSGGYTRIMKIARPRVGDKAAMAAIEYVDRPGEIRAARPPPSSQQPLSPPRTTTSSSMAETTILEQTLSRLSLSTEQATVVPS